MRKKMMEFWDKKTWPNIKEKGDESDFVWL